MLIKLKDTFSESSLIRVAIGLFTVFVSRILFHRPIAYTVDMSAADPSTVWPMVVLNCQLSATRPSYSRDTRSILPDNCLKSTYWNAL